MGVLFQTDANLLCIAIETVNVSPVVFMSL